MITLVTVLLSTMAFMACCVAVGVRLMALGTRKLRATVRTRPASDLGLRGRQPPLPSRIFPRSALRQQAIAIQARLPSPGRVVAAARHGLQQDVRGAARAVALGLEAGRPVHPLADITRRLTRSVADLDTDLAVIAAEPDARRRQALVAAQRERIQALHRACAQVRDGVLLAGGTTSSQPLSQVVDSLNDEVIRLGLWAQAQHELARPS